MHFEYITPTVFLRRTIDSLAQLVRVSIQNANSPVTGEVTGEVTVEINGHAVTNRLSIPSGESTHELFLPTITTPVDIVFTLQHDGKVSDTCRMPWTPPRQWTVHVVQRSHHDVGYTDLASHVLPEHAEMWDEVIDFTQATRDYPDDARFRMITEQTWSIDYYLKHASPERAAQMIELLRSGDIELTALFGNMTTELCGSETLARSVYHAFRLKRQHGIPIISAEHNDVPGFTWGLCQVLSAAGVRLFCPGLPHYYNWGNPEATSFWDDKAILGTSGIPGVFWWEAQDGARVLFWYEHGFSSTCHPSFPGLAEQLQHLETGGYPYSVLRLSASGGRRDNSPYSCAFAHAIKAWNEQWAFPRLICSTNARFYTDLLPQLPVTVPVHRGDLPGQDYPVGATSTAAATAVNRRNHDDLPAAEALATIAEVVSDYVYQHERIFQGYEEALWHDEHTWGHHFPCGPTANTSELEKALHAHRGATLAHDVANKAMARVADTVQLASDDIHLVVFNTLPYTRTGVVCTSMREIDNCGSTMAWEDDACGGILRGVLLGNRWHVNLPPELLDGQFDLLDTVSGETMPFQIIELDTPYAPTPYAAQRVGLGSGGKRYGFFERPVGIMRDLIFNAENVPALGYRTYCLRPRTDCPTFTAGVSVTDTMLENVYYRIDVDPHTGFITGIIDKASGRNLVAVDSEYPFGEFVVRDPRGEVMGSTCMEVKPGVQGPLCASLRIIRTAPGHPHIEQTITLYAGVKTVEFAVSVLKDPTPLLDASIAFPFHLPGGHVFHDGPFSTVEAGAQMLPGAYADRLTVQHGVTFTSNDLSLAWSSLDAPIVSLGRLWPGRFSPAHSSYIRDDIEHPRPTVEALRGGAIYSCITHNNCGTNFAVSQSGTLLFRYAFTTQTGSNPDMRFGDACHVPLQTILTKGEGARTLPPAQSFLAIDHPVVRLTALKRAEDGRGFILRLWNAGAAPTSVTVSLPLLTVRQAHFTTLAEEDLPEAPLFTKHALTLDLAPWAIATVRLLD